VVVGRGVIGNSTVRVGLFNSALLVSAATPSPVPTPTRVLRVADGPTRSMYDSTRDTLLPMNSVSAKTASVVPSGAIAPDAEPTRSASRPSYLSDVLPEGGASAGVRLTATSVAVLWFPTSSVAVSDRRSSAAAATVSVNDPSAAARPVPNAPVAPFVARTVAPFSTAPNEPDTVETPLDGGAALMRAASGEAGAVRSMTIVRVAVTTSPRTP